MKPAAFAIAACAILTTAAAAHAGAIIDIDVLTPPNTPGGAYSGGSLVDFAVSISTDLGEPAQIRLLTLDFSGSSPNLTLGGGGVWCEFPPCTYEFEFDLSSIPVDAGYAKWPVYPRPNITYTLPEPWPGFVLEIPANDSLLIGHAWVELPVAATTATLDVLSPSSPEGGAVLTVGFDPSMTWTVGLGDITGEPVVFTVIPEPATVWLVLMCAGAWARRRRFDAGHSPGSNGAHRARPG